MRVVAVHLLNDYSGSPKVLMQLLKSWSKKNVDTHLFTCSGNEGFLSNIHHINNHFYWYRFQKNAIARLVFFLSSQLILCIKLLFFLKKSDVLYINTVLPFGAAIAGIIKGCKVIYHIHETSIKPKILKRFLFGIVEWSASEVVYVSHFLSNQEFIKTKRNVLYNVLEDRFVKQAQENFNQYKKEKIILMICSLKTYKGVDQFLELAKNNQHFTFKLVVNANQNAINEYFKDTQLPANLVIYPTQKNTLQFYQEASILLNLSDVNSWVETFGLTVLEGMAYGLPAIVPPVGGIVELVENNQNGYQINSKNISLISEKINDLLTNPKLYDTMSKNAIKKSSTFNEAYFENKAYQIISNY